MRWFQGALAAIAIVAAALVPVSALGAASASATAKLPCSARMTDSRPADHVTDSVRVTTASDARVVTVAHFSSGRVKKKTRAGATGHAELAFKVGKAPYGHTVAVRVSVYRGSRYGSCSASFTPTKYYFVSSCTSSGDFATCVEAGDATKPVTIQVHVTASPNQSVSVAWDDVCSLGLSAASSSGQFTARTPIVRTIHHPFTHPDSCTISADAQLSGSGSLKVWTTYTR